jgi:hypothetical protein
LSATDSDAAACSSILALYERRFQRETGPSRFP